MKPRHSGLERYVLGSGHVVFFLDKGKWLEKRHKDIYEEMMSRGMNTTIPILELGWDNEFMNDWEPSDNEMMTNLDRIIDRIENGKIKHTWRK